MNKGISYSEKIVMSNDLIVKIRMFYYFIRYKIKNPGK